MVGVVQVVAARRSASASVGGSFRTRVEALGSSRLPGDFDAAGHWCSPVHRAVRLQVGRVGLLLALGLPIHLFVTRILFGGSWQP